MNNVKKVLRKLGTKAKDFIMSLKKKKARLSAQIATYFMSALSLAATAFAKSGGGSSGGAGEEQFNIVINFFATWIGRIGLIVGFVGAVMFGLAIKNDDADAKTRGLMTLAAGFVVFAVTKALDMFMV